MSGLPISVKSARVAIGVALAGLLAAPGFVLSQSLEEQIAGAWRIVSIYNEVKGVKRHFYGENPVGLAIFERSGYVSVFLSKAELPRFAASNRLKGTDKEYREVMQGMIAQFGTYTVEGDEVVFKWIASSYPNRAGSTEKRVFKIAGDQMTAVNPTAASGGTSYVNYVRAK